MKKALLVLTLFFMVLINCNVSFAFQNEPDGFRNLKFGMSIKQVEEVVGKDALERISRHDAKDKKDTVNEAYLLKLNPPMISNLKTDKQAEIHFFKDQLMSVSILLHGDKNKYLLTLYMDLWNNEIVSHSLSAKRGDRMTYISGLENLIEWQKRHPEHQMVLHSDQGSVYASKAYNELLPMYGITRSMSRAGTPTDNAAMESINGWIKAELFMDLHVTGEKPVKEEVDDYILFFNEQRPAYSLGYLTPKQYRERHTPIC